VKRSTHGRAGARSIAQRPWLEMRAARVSNSRGGLWLPKGGSRRPRNKPRDLVPSASVSCWNRNERAEAGRRGKRTVDIEFPSRLREQGRSRKAATVATLVVWSLARHPVTKYFSAPLEVSTRYSLKLCGDPGTVVLARMGVDRIIESTQKGTFAGSPYSRGRAALRIDSVRLRCGKW
jgi:hypothetical protein